MKTFVPDLVSDTYTLSDAEFGAYWRICMALWRFKGVLPNDPAKLRKIAGTTPKAWSGRWAAISHYFVIEDGWISQGRVTADLLEAGVDPTRDAERRPKVPPPRPHAGSPSRPDRSAKPLENNKPASAYARARDSQLQPQLEPEIEAATPSEQQQPRARTTDDWPDGGMDGWVIKLAAMSGGKLDVTKEPQLYETRTLVAQWKLNGFSFSLDVMPTIMARCKKAKRPICSWAYFNNSVRDAHARRMGFAAPITADDVSPHGGDHHDDKLARKRANLERSLDGADLVHELVRARGGDGFSGD